MDPSSSERTDPTGGSTAHRLPAFALDPLHRAPDPLLTCEGSGSETLYRDLLSASADLVLQVDAADRIVGASPGAEAWLAAAPGSLDYVALTDHLYPGSERLIQEALALARDDPGRPRDLRGVRLLASLEELAVPTPRLNLHLIASPGGDVLMAGRAALAEPPALQADTSRDRFYRIYHSSPDAILILRIADLSILDFNEGFTSLLGYTREDAIGREETELELWPSSDERARVFDRLSEERMVTDVETVLQTRDGTPRPVAISLRYMEFGDELCVLAVARDISARLEAESAARRSEAKFAQVFRESPDGIIILRQRDLVICDVNPAFQIGSGLSIDELVGKRVDEFHGAFESRALEAALRQISTSGWFRNVEMSFAHVSGKEIPALVSGALIDLDGEPGVLCVAKNVSELRQAQEQLRRSEARFRGVFENAPIGILLLDLEGRIFQANRFAEDLLEYTSDTLEGRPITELVPTDDREAFLYQLNTLVQGTELTSRSERRLLCANGREIWTTVNIVAQRDDDNQPLYCIVQVADITEMKRSQQTMERLAFYDTLTDLANRRLFNERLSQAVEQCRRDNRQAALLYLDLDQFKRVNDTLGHDSGDILLREVADRLLQCVRGVDTVARTGGDEFTILICDLESPIAAADVARRILEVLRDPIRIAGHDLVVTTSIGITLIPDDGCEASRLLKNADLAMYRAKENGRNNYQYYSEDLNVRAVGRLRTENELRLALERGEFALHYQPKISLLDRAVIGVECLLRWEHPERGLLMPGEFIGVAEESGVITEVGRWVVEEACKAGRELIRAAGRPLSIGVNISPRQFRDPTLVQTIQAALRRAGLSPASLELEITETMLMQDTEAASKMVRRLAQLGVSLAIDDFGTGYSSLNYLRKFPISTVKVDRSFIRDIPDSSDDMAITAAVIAMAHKLNMRVVAEGVETDAQMAFLLEHRCDQAQGYLFSRALPLPDTHAFLQSTGTG